MGKEKISIFFNTGIFSRTDIFTSILSNKILLILNAKKVLKLFIDKTDLKLLSSDKQVIPIKFYKGNNDYIKKMITSLIDRLSNDLIGAYVHGSMGTGTEIKYSDFDGLIILKDAVFEDKKRLLRVARYLYRSRKIMYQLDPLQHHGWFILTESDLKNYPQTYFPHELFKYSKSLFPDKGTKLEIFLNRDGYDYKKPFFDLANSIIKKIEMNKFPKNMYQLKSLLSEFMLMPALYVQARDKKGVFKKYSFDLARKDFSKVDWEIMDEVSEIRLNWHYKMGKLKKSLFTITNPGWRKLFTKYLSPNIPDDIKKKLTPEFYLRIKLLCEKMKERLKS